MILYLFFYVDINSASLEELYSLPLDSAKVREIYRYRKVHGPFHSIYDLLYLKGFTPMDIKRLKGVGYVKRPAITRENWWGIKNTEKKLAQEEGPGKIALDFWEDVVVYPLNINRVEAEELLRLYGVSMTDVQAILNYRKNNKIRGTRDLKWRIPDLSVYGYINIKNYIKFKDTEDVLYSGNFRYRISYPMVEDKGIVYYIKDLLTEIDSWETEDREEIKKRMLLLDSILMTNRFFHGTRLKLKLKTRSSMGVGMYDYGSFKTYRFSSVIRKRGIIENLTVGDYRVSLNQGVLLDNSPDLMPRSYNKYPGIYGDIGEEEAFAFRGISLELRKKDVSLLSLYSLKDREGYVKPEGAVTYFIDPFKTGVYKAKFKEEVMGTFIKIGYRRSVSGVCGGIFRVKYDRDFLPSNLDFDRPGDKFLFEDSIPYPVKWREAYFAGIGGQTLIKGFEMSGEMGYRIGGGYATILKLRYQKPVWYIMVLIRDYTEGYENPFNRGFTEKKVFEDTPIEKPYRLKDPYLSYLDELPVPKPHHGIYFETRYQLSRKFVIKKIYFDIWKDYPFYLPSYRFQYQFQYRPLLPISLEFKHKVQKREKAGEFNDRYSLLNEVSFILRTRVRYIYMSLEYMKSQDEFLPNPKYSSSVIYGDMIKVSAEGEFYKGLSVDAGGNIFLGNGMSLWSFEDVGIDFLEDMGSKWYVSLIYRPSWSMLIKFKIRDKRRMIPSSDGTIVFLSDTYNLSYLFQIDIFFK